MIESDNPERINITMYMRRDDGSVVNISQYYSPDCTWKEIAMQFHSFLSGMSYSVKPEDVGVEW